MKKSTLFVIMVIMSCIQLCAAEGIYNTGWTETYDQCVCVSQQYTYIATGGWNYLESWSPQWYDIVVVNNSTAQLFSMDRLYGYIHMLPHVNGILIINQVKRKESGYALHILQLENGKLNPELLSNNEYAEIGDILDLVLWKDELLILTDKYIYSIDINTLDIDTIYKTDAEIMNCSYNNRSFIVQDKLYISDSYGRIISLDLFSHESVVLVDNYCTVYDELLDCSEPYGYMVICNELLYYDAVKGCTVAKNIENGTSHILFDGKTGFYPVNSKQVIVTIYVEKEDSFTGTFMDSYTITYDIP